MRDDLLKIFNHYGVSKQLKKFNEESFELMEAIIDYENSIGSKQHIIEEIADVFVLLRQFIEYYEITYDDIDIIRKQKIERQLKRIEEENMKD